MDGEKGRIVNTCVTVRLTMKEGRRRRRCTETEKFRVGLRSESTDEAWKGGGIIYWQEPWLFASIMQNPDTISRRESPTRGSRPKSRMERKSAGGPHRSSITIGNKSKADATGCCLRGQPSSIPPPLSLPRRFFSPPADNTTVFNKYKTIHETVSTPFHFIYIYSLGTLLEFLEALWISINWCVYRNGFPLSNTPSWV